MDPVTREANAKIAANYNPKLEQDLRGWITQQTGERLGPDFIGDLRNGVILCKLAGVQKRINKPGMPFKEMENLENFNKRCRELGLHDADLFVTNDLYNRVNPTQVLQNLSALREKLSGGGSSYQGRSHNVRQSGSNRVFDSKPAQVNLKGGSFGLRNKFEGKPEQRQQKPPAVGGRVGGGARFGAGASSGGSGAGGPKFCAECGSRAGAGKKFCAECGTRL